GLSGVVRIGTASRVRRVSLRNGRAVVRRSPGRQRAREQATRHLLSRAENSTPLEPALIVNSWLPLTPAAANVSGRHLMGGDSATTGVTDRVELRQWRAISSMRSVPVVICHASTRRLAGFSGR